MISRPVSQKVQASSHWVKQGVVACDFIGFLETGQRIHHAWALTEGYRAPFIAMVPLVVPEGIKAASSAK
ncbi:hypothetical protein C4E04_00180 [Microvirga sp. 17 mud 1-3]|nr:hypothetical protein C4E04_00180 [Microvirga sp. 17 mud 1-3]